MGLKKGQTNNPNGRPKKSKRIAEKVRNNPKCIKVWESIFRIALTLGTEKEHKEAMQACKLIADKTVPSLRAQELELDPETIRNLGVIMLPTKKRIGEKVDEKSSLETESRSAN